jgi:hypothetical protein
MFNAEEEFAKLNFKDAKITVPRMSIGGSGVAYRIRKREVLRELGVAFDIFSDTELYGEVKKRAQHYESLISQAEDMILRKEPLPQDLRNEIYTESFWYNRVVLGISEEETQRMIEEANNATSNS